MTEQRPRPAGTIGSSVITREQQSRESLKNPNKPDDNPPAAVSQMDREHLELHVQEVEFSAAVDAGVSRAEILVRLAQLLDSFQRHFESEEGLMRSNSFPGLKQHSDEHRRLIGQMSGFRDDIDSGLISRCGALALFVRSWFEQHLAGSDAHFVHFLNEQKTGCGSSLISKM